MSNTKDENKRDRVIHFAIITVFTLAFAVFELCAFSYTQDAVKNAWIGRILSNTCAGIAVLVLLRVLKTKPFGCVKKGIVLLPCLAVALANLPILSYFNGNMQIVRTDAWDIVLFVFYCVSVGFIEELVFRGVLFPALLGNFSRDKKGIWKAFVLSSVFFGVAHLTNLFNGAGIVPTLLQTLYTTLTGGLFCFAFIKTKNVLCSAGIHAVYNIGGLIFDTPQRLGLGSGVVFDAPTVIVMVIIDVAVAVYVLLSMKNLSKTEQTDLYQQVGLTV